MNKVRVFRFVSPEGTHDPVARPPILQSRSVAYETDVNEQCIGEPVALTQWTNVEHVFSDREYRFAQGQQ